jgi:hypothetical protein
MLRRGAEPWLVLCGLLTSACALVGYDFDHYHAGAAEPTATMSSSGGGDEPAATTFSAGGVSEEPAPDGDPAGGNPGGEAGAAACQPRGCSILPASCGVLDDGCGTPLDCGQCFWWFEECRQHLCQIPQ